MQRRWKWLGVVAILALLAVPTASRLLQYPRVTDSRYQRIHVGQSLAEVEAIIGGPPGSYGGGPLSEYRPETIMWRAPDKSAADLPEIKLEGLQAQPAAHFGTEVSLIDGFAPSRCWGFGCSFSSAASMIEHQPQKRPTRRVVWTGLDYAIAVQLDADDRVVATCLAQSSREPGMFERWLAKLGIK